jgi:hypothetical protein
MQGGVMQQFPDAKWSYVTGNVTDRGATRLGSLAREPRLGDLVAARVVSLNAHDSLENIKGRHVRLYPGGCAGGGVR